MRSLPRAPTKAELAPLAERLKWARDAALAAIDGLIEQQAAMLAYDYIFLWIGLLFAVCLLLLPFLKSGSNAPVEKHVAVD